MNKYIFSTKNVTVTEERAVTDDSVRLLNEMQEAAKQNIIAAFELKKNNLTALCYVFQNPYALSIAEGYINTNINGKDFSIKFSFNYENFLCLSHIKNVFERKIATKLAEIITEQLMEDECSIVDLLSNKPRQR